MVMFAVQERVKSKSGQMRVVRENHFVRLAHGREAVAYIQNGVLQWEDGTPLTEEEAKGWQADIAAIRPEARIACGLDAPNRGGGRTPPVRSVWLYGPQEDQDICIANGQFFHVSGRQLDAEDLPYWAQGKLREMSNNDRKRAGLLPVNQEEVQRASERDDRDDRQGSEPLIECHVCGVMLPNAQMAAHSESCSRPKKKGG